MNPLLIPIGPVSSSCADSSQTTSSGWFHIQWSPRLARSYARCGFWSEISEVTDRVECLDLSAFLVGLYACHNMGTFKLSRPIHRIVAMVIDAWELRVELLGLKSLFMWVFWIQQHFYTL